ncbi:MAG: hypothetical protein L0215_00915 [Gemmataceae bacterium]|nr:hypothetical protein [Gemmataceae bacterium]
MVYSLSPEHNASPMSAVFEKRDEFLIESPKLVPDPFSALGYSLFGERGNLLPIEVFIESVLLEQLKPILEFRCQMTLIKHPQPVDENLQFRRFEGLLENRLKPLHVDLATRCHYEVDNLFRI